jgi:glucosyl-3-phosphoglycerate phosphatase
VDVMQVVRERTAFVCDVGSSPGLLASRFPRHDFAHLPQRWWHAGVESEEETVARADSFRAQMAAREDSARVLVVSHWAFILALCGKSTDNGEIVDYDPKRGPPRRLRTSTRS